MSQLRGPYGDVTTEGNVVSCRDPGTEREHQIKTREMWDFPGSPVVRVYAPDAGGPGFNPRSGNWILQAATKSLYATVKTEDPTCRTQGLAPPNQPSN